jgi:ribonuclease HI
VTKINVDAAVSKNTGLGTVAAVARDEEGVFCGASAVVFPGKTDAETLEALACREALSLAQDINTRQVRVASDCLNVTQSMDQGTMGAYAHVVREFKETARELDNLAMSVRCRIRRLIT